MTMLQKALDELSLNGLLLKSDPKLPSVTTLVAREPVRGDSVHTSSGKHSKRLENWQRWADRIGVTASTRAEPAKLEFEQIVGSLNRRFQARGTMPWVRISR